MYALFGNSDSTVHPMHAAVNAPHICCARALYTRGSGETSEHIARRMLKCKDHSRSFNDNSYVNNKHDSEIQQCCVPSRCRLEPRDIASS